MKKTFKFYTDPGHGWVAVKIELIRELGVLDQISTYSYYRGLTAFLEEDCDATIFLDAYKAKYGEFDLQYKHTDKRSPIRSYDRFKQYGGVL